MNIRVNILRRTDAQAQSYWNSFELNADGRNPITWILDTLNHRCPLVNEDGEPVSPIVWECSCNQQQCGGCAMVINGTPALACSTFIGDLCKRDGDQITITPLTKFPVVRDLYVDRSALYAHLRDMKLWLSEDSDAKNGTDVLYDAASCLMCGCCLEVCPNYSGASEFYGAQAMNDALLRISQEPDRKHRREMTRALIEHGTSGCSRSLGCDRVCPAGIPLNQHVSRVYGKLFGYYLGL